MSIVFLYFDGKVIVRKGILSYFSFSVLIFLT